MLNQILFIKKGRPEKPSLFFIIYKNQDRGLAPCALLLIPYYLFAWQRSMRLSISIASCESK